MIGELLSSPTRAVTASAGLALLVPFTASPKIIRSDTSARHPVSGDIKSQNKSGGRNTRLSGLARSPLLRDPQSEVSAAVSERPTRAARMAAAWARIQEYGHLEADWAGPGTVPPSASTISLARTVLSGLPSQVDVPHVAPSGDGEIVLTWLVIGDRLEASIDEDGYLSWATRIGGQISPGGSINLSERPLDDFKQVLLHDFA